MVCRGGEGSLSVFAASFCPLAHPSSLGPSAVGVVIIPILLTRPPASEQGSSMLKITWKEGIELRPESFVSKSHVLYSALHTHLFLLLIATPPTLVLMQWGWGEDGERLQLRWPV